MKLVPILIATLALGACTGATETASSAPAKGRACFQTRDVQNWQKESDKSVLLRVRRNDIYRADLISPCLDLEFAFHIAVQSRVSPWICEGDDAYIYPERKDNPAERCDAVKFRKLTPDEVSALGKKKP